MIGIKHKYLIIDTSILLVWLRVPGNNNCGPADNVWDFERVNDKINEELERGTTFVLPLASIIEAGNSITKVDEGHRGDYASCLVDVIRKTAEKKSPWAAFSSQNELWDSNKLYELANSWLNEISKKGKVLSLGDVSILYVAEYYSQLGEVEILSGDQGLVARQFQHKAYIPRRRQ